VIAHLLGLPLDFSMPTDLAERIKKWMLSECSLAFGKDLSKDSLVIRRITDTAQRASLILSPTQDYEIDLPFITADSQGPKHFRRKLSYGLLQPE
jgi:molecular chaperone DnaK